MDKNHNLAEALQEVFTAHSRDLAALNEAQSRAPVAAPVARDLAEQRRKQRLANDDHVWSLHQKGWTAQAIATHVGISSRTVCRFLRTSTFPERHPRRQLDLTLLEPFKAHVLKRWNEGCRNAAQLCREIKLQGFRGQYATVARYASRLRAAQGVVPTADQPAHPPPVVEAAKPLTPRGATWLVMRREEHLDDEASRQLALLQEQEGEIAVAIALTTSFSDLVRQRQSEGLDAWEYGSG